MGIYKFWTYDFAQNVQGDKMSIEIKVYLTPVQIEENLCFHSRVNSKEDYDILFDLNETYEPLFVEALNGTLNINCMNTSTFDKTIYSIDSEDYITNIDSFVSLLIDIYGLCVQTNESNLLQHFGVILRGAGFRGRQEDAMIETSKFNAMNSMHSIKNQLFTNPANNTDFSKDDVYIKQDHGSLKLTLETTKRYEEPINFIRLIYNDIENETIDPFKFDDKDEQYRYQTIIKNLNDLNLHKRLKTFIITIEGEELEITKRDYLKESSKNIYNEPFEIIGIFETYKVRTNTFELYSERNGKYYCHLNNLQSTDNDSFQEILDIFRGLDNFRQTRIRVNGTKVKPQTINVTNVEIL